MQANEVPESSFAVDCEGTVWAPCGSGRERFWRYIVEDGVLSWDQFRELPTKYEPYVVLDAAVSSLIYRHLQKPKEPWATVKR